MMRIDFQDILLIAGVSSIVGGAWCWNRPAASVVFGIFCLIAVAGRARSPRERGQKGKN